MNSIVPAFVTSLYGVRAAVSTRVGGVSTPPLDLNLSFNVGDDALHVKKNRELFFGSLGIGVDALALPQQVHGNTVRRVDRPGLYPACDALVSNVPGVYLGVTVADCIPLLIFDAAKRAVSAVHVGWRGSLARVASKALETLAAEYSSRPEDVFAFLGPSAGVCCYEVGEKIARRFDSSDFQTRNGRIFLDLKSVTRRHLSAFGIPEAHIEFSAQCTICSPSVFHSFRREREKSGRMMGVVGLSA
jgi:YfiH family protein